MSEARTLALEEAPAELRDLVLEEVLSHGRDPANPGTAMNLRLACAGWDLDTDANSAFVLRPLRAGLVDLLCRLAVDRLSGHERMRLAAVREATRTQAESLLSGDSGGAGH